MRDPMPIINQKYTTGNSRYKAAEIYTPVGVVLHSIGVPQPRAQVLRDSWQRNASQYVTHYVLDDSEVIQCMPNNFKCWHCGSPGNGKWIGIEMCEPKQIKYTSGAKFTVGDLAAAQNYAMKCYKNAVWLIALLCKNYGWNPYSAILTHGQITKRKLSNTDHVDPEHLWDGLGMGYDLGTLQRDVAAAMLIDPKPEPQKTEESKGHMYRIRKSWDDAESQIGAYGVLENAIAACKDGYAVFDETGKQVYPFKSYAVRITASALNIRKGPSTRYPVDQTIANGGVYTIVEEIDGWGLLKAYAKARNGWVNLAYTERI
jgi:uncharacterized protein YraI